MMSRTNSKESNGSLKLMNLQSSPSQPQQQQQEQWYIQPHSVGSSKQTSLLISSQQVFCMMYYVYNLFIFLYISMMYFVIVFMIRGIVYRWNTTILI